MKYEEYKKRKKKEKQLEKVKSSHRSNHKTISIEACNDESSDLQPEVKEIETNVWRQRWWRFWRSKRPSSNAKSSLT